MTTTKDLLNSGGGAPTAKFPTVGTAVSGIIKSKKVSQQTDIDGVDKFWPDGNPMMQIEVTVLTDDRDPSIDDDDGSRRIFVRGYMMNAVSEAVQNAGVDDIEPGGTLTITFSSTKPAKHAAYSPAKLYEASYTPPANAPAPSTNGASNNSSFGDEEPF